MARKTFWTFVMLFVLLVQDFCTCEDDIGPLANIPSLGQIRGSFMESASGRQFLAFRGVPYAKPPVGPLRFKDPVPVDPWYGKMIKGDQEGPVCVQLDSLGMPQGTEDCLKLNIYTHDTNPTGGRVKPVLVWIHGGSFKLGSGNGESGIYGPGYIMDRDVVLVSINYRLGAFGFFTSGDSEAPGNYGLLDQSLALRWIRKNIRYFGGDQYSITIFGGSSGAASVQYHILSPYSRGLFDRAISQSGSALCPWAISQEKNVEKYSAMLAEELECPTHTSRQMVDCLRDKNATEFVGFIKNKQILGFFPMMVFGPRVDSERTSPFLPDEPRKLIEQKRFNPVPYISGLAQNEGAMIVATLMSKRGKGMEEFKRDPMKYIPYLLAFDSRENRQRIAHSINEYYFNSRKPYHDQLTEIEQMSSDFNYNKCIDDSVHLFGNYSSQPIFYYQYAHQSRFSFELLMGLPSNFNQGVSHASEIFMLFSVPLFPNIYSSDDIKVSKMLLDFWISFAANGVPSSQLTAGHSWLPLDRNFGTRYFRIEAEQPEMVHQQMPFYHRMAFVDHVFTNTPINDEL